MVDEILNGWSFFEVATFTELQDTIASVPAMVYVRELDDYFLLHDASYVDGDLTNAPLWVKHSDVGSGLGIFKVEANASSVPIASWIFSLLATGMRQVDVNNYPGDFAVLSTLSYSDKLRYLMDYLQDEEFRALGTSRISRFLNREPLNGDIFISGGEIRCHTDGLGIKVLKEGESGITIQKSQPLTLNVQYNNHSKRVGVIVLAKGAKKGDSTLTCSFVPSSLPHTKQNSNAKHWVTDYNRPKPVPSAWPLGDPGYIRPPDYWSEPQTCLVDPRTLPDPANQQNDLPYALEHACWCAAPWSNVQVPVNGIAYHSGGPWPDGLTATVSFAEPIPQPIYSGVGLLFHTDNPYRYMPPPDRSTTAYNAGLLGGYLGQNSLPVRMYTLRHGQTGNWIYSGDRAFSLYDPTAYAQSWSGFRGAMQDDMLAFETHETIYRITDVKVAADYKPYRVSISPGAQYEMPYVVPIGDGQHAFIGPNVYWLPTGARSGWWTSYFSAWTLPDDDIGPLFNNTGFPVFLKRVRGKLVDLVCPLAEDIPAGTRMPIYSFADNDTTTLAFKDVEGFVLEVERYNYVRDDLGSQNLIDLYVQLQQDYADLMLDLEVAHTNTRYNWFMPPNYGAYDPYLTHKKHGSTFQEAITNCTKRMTTIQMLLRIPEGSFNKIEYLSLLNYDRGVHVEPYV